MIGIVDYGSGNIQAIANIYKKLNISHKIISNPDDLFLANRLILPGVGSFDETMKELINSGLKLKLDDLVMNKNIPVLGICVGMQIMSNESEEGNLPGLGWIEGKVKKFDISKMSEKPFIPHMGWNKIFRCEENSIFNGIDNDIGFYFVHSYFFECKNKNNQLSSTLYGIEFSSSIFKNNIYGTQFHPEKSHGNGVKLLYNFATMKLC